MAFSSIFVLTALVILAVLFGVTYQRKELKGAVLAAAMGFILLAVIFAALLAAISGSMAN